MADANSLKEGRLVLARRARQSILIGQDVEVEVLQVCGNTVRFRVHAPQNVKVLRKELTETGIK